VDERKVVTVLFADLVASTELGGSQDPDRTRALLERFYEAMAAEIAAAGGTVEKFAGDAVMAAFGAPAAYEDHAKTATAETSPPTAVRTPGIVTQKLRPSFGIRWSTPYTCLSVRRPTQPQGGDGTDRVLGGPIQVSAPFWPAVPS